MICRRPPRGPSLICSRSRAELSRTIHLVERFSPAAGDIFSFPKRKTANVRDHYSIGKRLGQGQFSTTYQCVGKADGAEYACKSIPKRKLLCREDYYQELGKQRFSFAVGIMRIGGPAQARSPLMFDLERTLLAASNLLCFLLGSAQILYFLSIRFCAVFFGFDSDWILGGKLWWHMTCMHAEACSSRGRRLCCSSSMIPMPLFPNFCFSFLIAFSGLYTDLVIDDEELGKKNLLVD
jgi:hypothetical protein